MQLTNFLLLAAYAVAAPTSSKEESKQSNTTLELSPWNYQWARDFSVHKTCNLTQAHQLTQAFEETRILAEHAKDHTLRYGNLSEFYQKYFGNAPSGEVVGIFENVVSANKTGIEFRCDDIDGKCKFDGWAGHHRGENGTDETVICDLSYTSRLFLSQVCSRGYTVAGSANNLYWSSDLLHRIWHTDKLGQGVVGHYADTYTDCLELAEKNETLSVRNSASLRYFALDVYAYDIAVPGVGCTGEPKEEEDSHSDSHSDSSTSTPSGKECHTHSDGEVHCV